MSSWQWLSGDLIYGALITLVVVPLICLYVRGREKAYFQSFGALWRRWMAHEYRWPWGVVRVVAVTLGLACLWLALAQPRDGYTLREWQSKGRNILIAVDVSRSMLATDMSPSRLEWAKREIFDFLDLLKGDRVGLLIFAHQAYPHLPLTQDYAMVRLFVQSLDPSLISAQGTDLKAAVDVALKSLQPDEGGALLSRDLVIITDGENHGPVVRELADKAKDLGVRIFTVGVGSVRGAPLQMADGQFLKDRQGKVVVSRLDESSLRELARRSGGFYVRSDVRDDGLKKIYEQGILKSKEVLQESRQDRIWNELFPWFLWGGFVFLVMAFFITPYKKRKNQRHHKLENPRVAERAYGVVSFLLFLSLVSVTFFPGPFSAGALPEVHPSFKQAYDLMQKNPSTIEDLNKAEDLLQRLIGSTADSDILHASYYNLFHIMVKKQKWQQAFEYLKKAYTYNEDHVPTLENLKWIADMLQKKESSSKQQSQPEKQDSSSDQAQKHQDSSDSDVQESQGEGSQPEEKSGGGKAGLQEQEEGSSGVVEKNQEEDQRREKNAGEEEPGSAEGSAERESSEEGGLLGEENQQSTAQGSRKQDNSSQESSSLEPEQALGLFRSLEENHRAYGRKRGPASSSSDEESEEAW